MKQVTSILLSVVMIVCSSRTLSAQFRLSAQILNQGSHSELRLSLQMQKGWRLHENSAGLDVLYVSSKGENISLSPLRFTANMSYESSSILKEQLGAYIDTMNMVSRFENMERLPAVLQIRFYGTIFKGDSLVTIDQIIKIYNEEIFFGVDTASDLLC